MRTFSVLLVDNDPDVALTVANALKDSKAPQSVSLKCADSYAKAESAIRGSYYHLAIVDLHLQSTVDKNNIDGALVLRFLAQHRPSCQRILCTKYLDKHNYE